MRRAHAGIELVFLVILLVLFFPLASLGGEKKNDEKKRESEESLDDELDELKEDDYPDLVGVDDKGELMDEFLFLGLEDEDVVYTASKHRQSIFWSPSTITVITRDDIRSSGATTIPDLLRRVPGFDVYEMKPSFPVVGARALTDDSNNLVLVLVDGREALVELAGFAVWASMTFDIEEVERVEVIRGPGSALYGANAFAAVVSITTVSDYPAGGGDVCLSLGEEGHRHLFGRIRDAWSLGDGTLSFSAGLGSEGRLSSSDRQDDIKQVHLRSHGYLRYRQGRKLDLSLHAGVSKGDGTIFMLLGDLRATNVLNHYVMGKAGIGLSESVELKAQIYHSRYYSDFHTYPMFQAYGVWLANVPDFFIDTHSVDGQVQLDFQATDDLLFIGGSNLRYTTMESDNIIPQEINELRGAGFIHLQWSLWGDGQLSLLQLTGGFRIDLNSETREALSPRAVVVFRPWSNHAFRLGYGLAFRKPAFTESRMHLNVKEASFPEVKEKMKTAVGNEGLVNEKVHSFEAGWRTRFLNERLQVFVNLFYNIYQDMIYFKAKMLFDSFGRPDVLRSTLKFLNEDAKVYAVGGEAEVDFSPTESWTFWGNFGLRRTTGEEGVRLPSEPQLRVNLGCRWDLHPGASSPGPVLDLALHYVSSYDMPWVDPENPLEEPEYMRLGNNLLLVGRLSYHLVEDGARRLEVGLSVRAPIGRQFREYPGIPIPPLSRSAVSSDAGGEMLVRLVSFYIRGSF